MERFTSTTMIAHTSTLDIISVETNLSVFRLIQSQDQISHTGSMKAQKPGKETEQEGFIDDKNLSKLRNGKPWKAREDLTILLAPGREMMRTKGYTECWTQNGPKAFFDNHLKNPFTAFQNGAATEEDIVSFRNECHMLFDRHGNPLPVAIPFDYISNGRISNTNYDLDKLIAHLLIRDDITIFPKKGGWRDDEADVTKKAKTAEEALCSIPYYNRDGGKTHTVYFSWAPTQEEYTKLWAYCLQNKQQYPSTYMHEAIFALDLLGLRANGATRCATYWEDIEAPSNADED